MLGVAEPGRPAGSSRLAQRRREAHLSQEALARLVGVGHSTIQRMERGEVANAKLVVLANCALVLGCEIEDLIEPVWRDWAPLRVQPTEQEIADAKRLSFLPRLERTRLAAQGDEAVLAENKRRAVKGLAALRRQFDRK